MCASADWFMCGFTSGAASLIDIRKSRNIHSWRLHETDMLACSVAPKSNNQLITTSLDQTMKVSYRLPHISSSKPKART